MKPYKLVPIKVLHIAFYVRSITSPLFDFLLASIDLSHRNAMFLVLSRVHRNCSFGSFIQFSEETTSVFSPIVYTSVFRSERFLDEILQFKCWTLMFVCSAPIFCDVPIVYWWNRIWVINT